MRTSFYPPDRMILSGGSLERTLQLPAHDSIRGTDAPTKTFHQFDTRGDVCRGPRAHRMQQRRSLGCVHSRDARRRPGLRRHLAVHPDPRTGQPRPRCTAERVDQFRTARQRAVRHLDDQRRRQPGDRVFDGHGLLDRRRWPDVRPETSTGTDVHGRHCPGCRRSGVQLGSPTRPGQWIRVDSAGRTDRGHRGRRRRNPESHDGRTEPGVRLVAGAVRTELDRLPHCAGEGPAGIRRKPCRRRAVHPHQVGSAGRAGTDPKPRLLGRAAAVSGRHHVASGSRREPASQCPHLRQRRPGLRRQLVEPEQGRKRGTVHLGGAARWRSVPRDEHPPGPVRRRSCATRGVSRTRPGRYQHRCLRGHRHGPSNALPRELAVLRGHRTVGSR